MRENLIITKICKVIDINDSTDGQRIKVRLSPEDDRKTDAELPFVHPLMPKLIHIKPKVGEFVLVFLTQAGNGNSNRHYIGPILSQPQYMDKDDNGIISLSLYPGSFKEPDVAPSTNVDSHGSLATDDDIAIYGRKKNDIILTEDDIRIRSGSRLKDMSANGNLVFNRLDPAFIHLKHTDKTRGENDDTYRSTATVVADKINLISNKSKYPFRTTDNKDMIADEEMQKIIEKAHQLPYGDVLVDFLKMFVDTFAAHTHPYPGMPPCTTHDFVETTSYDLNNILSDNVRIN